MTKSSSYEKIQLARRMEAVLLASAAIGGVIAVFTFMRYGWIAGFCVALLTLITFSLSQLFSLGCELLMAIERKAESGAPEKRGEIEKTS
jgi:hypothetical protein